MISSLELARICGISQDTVDRAMHGRGGIAKTTRKNILKAADIHGYAPNPAAREIMTGRSACCGAVIPAKAGIFFMDLLEELRKALKIRRLTLLLTFAAGEQEMTDAILEMASRRVRGIVLVPPSDDYQVPLAASASCKVVSLARPCVGTVYIAPYEVRTGYKAARYLWGLGHRQIAMLSYSRIAKAISDRLEGYGRLMSEKDLKSSILRQPSDNDILKLYELESTTAIFCHNDWTALNCMRTLEKEVSKCRLKSR